MTTEELIKKNKKNIKELEELNEFALKIAQATIGETLFLTDLYFCAVLNKSIQLTDGFILLIQERNLTSAGILLRSCMDNCLRMFAMYLAEDPEVLVEYIMDGKKISNLKDKNGNYLKDFYLKERLGEYDEHFIDVYNNASGYVHFSEKGFYQAVSYGGKNKVGVQVSHSVPEKANEFIVECTEAYIYFLKLLYSLFEDIVRYKRQYDEAHKEEE